MAMVHHNIHSLFSMIKFFQPGSVIKKQADEKIKLLNAKIEERKKRIARIRTDYKITDADLVELLSEKARNQFAQQGSYTISNKVSHDGGEKGEEITIAAGVINNINTENNLIGQEQEHSARLSLLARNIDVNVKHEVTFEELEYLML